MAKIVIIKTIVKLFPQYLRRRIIRIRDAKEPQRGGMFVEIQTGRQNAVRYENKNHAYFGIQAANYVC